MSDENKIRILGMETVEDEELNKAQITNPEYYSSNEYNISWLGSPGSTNSASISTTYSGGTLLLSAVVTGTPTWGTACTITAVPTNCSLKSGAAKVVQGIDGGALGITIVLNVTPSSSYKNKTVKFSVSIAGATNAVFYAHGNIG